jgi:hypothetical protein
MHVCLWRWCYSQVRKEREAEEKADPLKAANALMARERAKVQTPRPKELSDALAILQVTNNISLRSSD